MNGNRCHQSRSVMMSPKMNSFLLCLYISMGSPPCVTTNSSGAYVYLIWVVHRVHIALIGQLDCSRCSLMYCSHPFDRHLIIYLTIILHVFFWLGYCNCYDFCRKVFIFAVVHLCWMHIYLCIVPVCHRLAISCSPFEKAASAVFEVD